MCRALFVYHTLTCVCCHVPLQNGIGAGFNVVCLVMCFIFPAKRKQQQQQPGQVLDQINPAANWGALRLQSFARPLPGSAAAAAAAGAGASGGGFFDLTQMRWRTGRMESLRNSSFVRMLSGTQRSSSVVSASDAAGAGAGAASIKECSTVHEAAAKDVRGGTGVMSKRASLGDVEQAHVVADSTCNSIDQQQGLARGGGPQL
jgi:hypothetical protein